MFKESLSQSKQFDQHFELIIMPGKFLDTFFSLVVWNFKIYDLNEFLQQIWQIDLTRIICLQCLHQTLEFQVLQQNSRVGRPNKQGRATTHQMICTARMWHNTGKAFIRHNQNKVKFMKKTSYKQVVTSNIPMLSQNLLCLRKVQR